jgi:hypothetical protein
MLSRHFVARYPGTCANCPDGITPGDTLMYDEDDMVIHVDCRHAPDVQGKVPEICTRCFLAKSTTGECGCG